MNELINLLEKSRGDWSFSVERRGEDFCICLRETETTLIASRERVTTAISLNIEDAIVDVLGVEVGIAWLHDQLAETGYLCIHPTANGGVAMDVTRT